MCVEGRFMGGRKDVMRHVVYGCDAIYMLKQRAMEGLGLRQHDVMQSIVYGGNDISCLDMFARTSLAPGPKIARRWPNMGPRRPA